MGLSQCCSSETVLPFGCSLHDELPMLLLLLPPPPLHFLLPVRLPDKVILPLLLQLLLLYLLGPLLALLDLIKECLQLLLLQRALCSQHLSPHQVLCLPLEDQLVHLLCPLLLRLCLAPRPLTECRKLIPQLLILLLLSCHLACQKLPLDDLLPLCKLDPFLMCINMGLVLALVPNGCGLQHVFLFGLQHSVAPLCWGKALIVRCNR
mmetsp:Transcript_72027/g.126928  ORF Transcript_72027/g.126928 Transcript_72027/m.126928 type:complete len:207 (-) Transcript_72027:1492-2112(-)